MKPSEDEDTEELRDEAFWDDDGALIFEEDDSEVADREFGREY